VLQEAIDFGPFQEIDFVMIGPSQPFSIWREARRSAGVATSFARKVVAMSILILLGLLVAVGLLNIAFVALNELVHLCTKMVKDL
jgi:hypothetical protein